MFIHDGQDLCRSFIRIHQDVKKPENKKVAVNTSKCVYLQNNL